MSVYDYEYISIENTIAKMSEYKGKLPVLLENGLLSPNQGLFPKYTNGVYSFGDTTLLVSRGLARESTRAIPHIFNQPEIVVITLKGLR